MCSTNKTLTITFQKNKNNFHYCISKFDKHWLLTKYQLKNTSISHCVCQRALLPIQEMQLELHLSKKRIWGRRKSWNQRRHPGIRAAPSNRKPGFNPTWDSSARWLLYFPGLFSEATTWLVTTLERCIVIVWSQEERALSLLVSLRKSQGRMCYPTLGCVSSGLFTRVGKKG